MTDVAKLSQAWIDFLRSQDAELEWASDDFIDLANEQPELAWQCLLAVVEADSSDDVLSALAEGPFEDLLAEYGLNFIERINALAKSKGEFSQLVNLVWIEGLPTDVQNKMRAIQSK